MCGLLPKRQKPKVPGQPNSMPGLRLSTYIVAYVVQVKGYRRLKEYLKEYRGCGMQCQHQYVAGQGDRIRMREAERRLAWEPSPATDTRSVVPPSCAAAGVSLVSENETPSMSRITKTNDFFSKMSSSKTLPARSKDIMLQLENFPPCQADVFLMKTRLFLSEKSEGIPGCSYPAPGTFRALVRVEISISNSRIHPPDTQRNCPGQSLDQGSLINEKCSQSDLMIRDPACWARLASLLE